MKNKIITTISVILASMAGFKIGKEFQKKSDKHKFENKDILKFKSYYNILNQWLLIKQEGKNIEQYFIDNNYSTIAIYGMGELGERLCKDLYKSSIKIKYAIDKNNKDVCSEFEFLIDLNIIGINDKFEKVDAIIVTPSFIFEEVKNLISKKIDCPIISLDNILFSI